MGGVDKGLDLEELAGLVSRRCAAVVLIGELRQRLADELERAGMEPEDIYQEKTMSEAVERAFSLARHPGAGAAATVVLSPACSSFDMFDSYAHRGEVFQQAVAALGAG